MSRTFSSGRSSDVDRGTQVVVSSVRQTRHAKRGVRRRRLLDMDVKQAITTDTSVTDYLSGSGPPGLQLLVFTCLITGCKLLFVYLFDNRLQTSIVYLFDNRLQTSIRCCVKWWTVSTQKKSRMANFCFLASMSGRVAKKSKLQTFLFCCINEWTSCQKKQVANFCFVASTGGRVAKKIKLQTSMFCCINEWTSSNKEQNANFSVSLRLRVDESSQN